MIKSLAFEEQSVSEDDSSCVENSEDFESRTAKATMGDQHRTMVEYTQPTLNSTSSCIVQPAIEANNFEVKASTMNIIYNQYQFDGFLDEDLNAHIKMFHDICATVK